ncbi:uncharacterized protein MCYG_00785 [Microsporum canis CBS 113480]|uniref:Uncharacterized protein n=1 Tax=Arthroderma otae (strain ATCC MYA-4605 / CBS 113480) TaxID=554155 RepID=C5FDC3_ARTOC|nr:uncharacterized protein MCYG_00785 [Microsporum canis CBS 113480]EEQ27897.1 predicted protein [Microsporum canis CBS 113480]
MLLLEDDTCLNSDVGVGFIIADINFDIDFVFISTSTTKAAKGATKPCVRDLLSHEKGRSKPPATQQDKGKGPEREDETFSDIKHEMLGENYDIKEGEEEGEDELSVPSEENLQHSSYIIWSTIITCLC